MQFAIFLATKVPFVNQKLLKISCSLANAEQLGQLAQLLWDMEMMNTSVLIGNGVTDKAKVDNSLCLASELI